MYYGGMGYYSSMIVLIPAMIFTMIVQGRIKRAYSRYSQVENSRLPLSYDAVVSAVSKAVTEQEVLSIVFVLEWGGE